MKKKILDFNILILLFLIGVLLFSTVQQALAAWPERPIEVIIPTRAGGGQDMVSRLVGDMMGKHLGVPFKYNNRSGATGEIALKMFLKAAPDGYTLMAPNTATISFMYGLRKLSFDWDKELEWLGITVVDPGVLVTHKDRPWKSAQEFIATAKKQKVRVAIAHWAMVETLALLQLMKQTGAQFELIPYNGFSRALPALVGNHVEAGLGKFVTT